MAEQRTKKLVLILAIFLPVTAVSMKANLAASIKAHLGVISDQFAFKL